MRTVRVEEDTHSRGRSTPGSCSYALEISPKYSVSSFVGFLKGKSSLILYERSPKDEVLRIGTGAWCRGCYVDTAGKNTKRIAEHIKHQLEEARQQSR